MERSDLVVVMHEIKQSISDILRIIINSVLLYNFPRKSRSLETTFLSKEWVCQRTGFGNIWRRSNRELEDVA